MKPTRPGNSRSSNRRPGIQGRLGLKVTIDGARIEFDDGWGLLRASNTSPVLVMRCEADTPKRLKEIQQLIEKKVHELNK